jgi:hypothetical protein
VEHQYRQVSHKPVTLDALHKTFDAMKPGESYELSRMYNAYCRARKSAGKQSMTNRRIIREALSLRDDVHIKWHRGQIALYRGAK